MATEGPITATSVAHRARQTHRSFSFALSHAVGTWLTSIISRPPLIIGRRSRVNPRRDHPPCYPHIFLAPVWPGCHARYDGAGTPTTAAGSASHASLRITPP